MLPTTLSRTAQWGWETPESDRRAHAPRLQFVMNRSAALFLACLSGLAPAASADLLVGRLVDANGVPVAFGDLDLIYSNGTGVPTTANQGTDALGQFAVTVPPGVFDVTFNPPPPPASTALQLVRNAVTVAGTTNIGDVMLPAGVTITGTVISPAGIGITGVNFDAVDVNDVDQATRYDTSVAAGTFAFNVPPGNYEVRLKPPTVAGQQLAPKAVQVNAQVSRDLGLVQLEYGWTVTAIVRNASGLPLVNCDIDVRDAATMLPIYTPDDDTISTGFVDVVLPTGSYYFDITPVFATGMACKRIGPMNVAATSTLGAVQLEAGLALTGVVRDANGAAVAGAGIDLALASSGLDIPLDGDRTNALGAYQVRVPAGTYTALFYGPSDSTLGAQSISGVTVATATTLDAVLPTSAGYLCFGDGSRTPCPCSNDSQVGAQEGCLSSLGVGARLRASGNARMSADSFVLSGSQMPNSNALYFQGTLASASGAGSAFGDGLLCAAGTVVRLGARTNTGNASQYPRVGDQPLSQKGQVTAGASRVYQVWYRNAVPYCTASTFNLSNAVQVVWAP